MSFPKLLQSKYTEWAVLLAIIALAAYLRLVNLPDNPYWYSDEAVHVNIAHHLAQGRVQLFAMNQSMLLFSRPPLFHLILAGLFSVFGEGLTTLRVFTALLGVLSVALLYFIIHRISKESALALLSALIFAIYPQAVLYSRFGFSYSLLTPMFILTLFGLYQYLDGRLRGLALAALMIGVGTVCDLAMYTLLPVMGLAVLVRRWRDLLWSLPLAALPFGIYAVLMLISVPDAFRYDVNYVFARVGGLPFLAQLASIALNCLALISQDFWMLAGVIGLFFLRPARLKWLCVLLLLLPIVVMGRSIALYNLSFYHMIPLLPLVALGTAALIRYGATAIWREARDGLNDLFKKRDWPDSTSQNGAVVGSGLLILLLVITPILTTLVIVNNNVRTHYTTDIEVFLINPDDARQTAAYINTHTTAQDRVIASSVVGWQFTAQTADFPMSVIYGGQDTTQLPGDIPHNRFAFDPDYRHTRYAVIDNLWRNWGAVHIPAVLSMLQDIETHWPKVFESGTIQVYQNPNDP
jgi:hypothetical protein